MDQQPFPHNPHTQGIQPLQTNGGEMATLIRTLTQLIDSQNEYMEQIRNRDRIFDDTVSEFQSAVRDLRGVISLTEGAAGSLGRILDNLETVTANLIPVEVTVQNADSPAEGPGE